MVRRHREPSFFDNHCSAIISFATVGMRSLRHSYNAKAIVWRMQSIVQVYGNGKQKTVSKSKTRSGVQIAARRHERRFRTRRREPQETCRPQGTGTSREGLHIEEPLRLAKRSARRYRRLRTARCARAEALPLPLLQRLASDFAPLGIDASCCTAAHQALAVMRKPASWENTVCPPVDVRYFAYCVTAAARFFSSSTSSTPGMPLNVVGTIPISL